MTTMFSENLKFLSNFDGTQFYVGTVAGVVINLKVASLEHAFNAVKTLNVDDQEKILSAPSPRAAKALGRKVELRPDWNSGCRVYTMRRLIDCKFQPDSNLSKALLATGNLYLTESNDWHDQFWGSCYCPQHRDIPGTNMLGEILMARRVYLGLTSP